MQANKLPARHPFLNYDPWTSTHLHGSASKPQYDGYASDITKVGQTKRYIYPNKQDARTLWYHDHGVHHTAENAYMGLAAQYHLHDDVEKGLRIPKWESAARRSPRTASPEQYDLPLDPGGQDVRRERRVPLRRRGPHRPVGRRRPGQRRAVAEPEGQASASTASGSSTPRSPAATGCS